MNSFTSIRKKTEFLDKSSKTIDNVPVINLVLFHSLPAPPTRLQFVKSSPDPLHDDSVVFRSFDHLPFLGHNRVVKLNSIRQKEQYTS